MSTPSAAPVEACPGFQRLIPINPAYATLPLEHAFNWSDCLAGVDAGQWYIVAFRSVRRETADEAMLIEYDERAHEEAQQWPGLQVYFRGQLTARRECLSLCVWETQHQARHAAHQPLHQAAVSLVAAMYDSYQLERYVLTKRSGSTESPLNASLDGEAGSSPNAVR